METNQTENAETADLNSAVEKTNNSNESTVENAAGQSVNDQKKLQNSNDVAEEKEKEGKIHTHDKDVAAKMKEKKLTATLELSAEEKAKQMEDDYNALGLKRCGNCPFTTSDEVLFNNHSSICTKKQGQKESVSLPQDGQILLNYSDQTYTCKTCSLTWMNKAEFYEHVVCHISIDPYVCMTCRQNFSSRVLIEQHARQAHPNGDSRCGLRGIKRGKQFVEELEKNGSLTLFGKITIPKTPRNQTSKVQPAGISKPIALSSESLVSTTPTLLIQTTVNSVNTYPIAATETHDKKITSIPILPNITVTNINNLSPNVTVLQSGDSSKIGSSYPDLRNLASKGRQILQKLQEKIQVPGSSVSIATVAQSARATDVGLKTTADSILSSANQNKPEKEVAPLFGVVNKDTGNLEPATIPSRIQTIVPGQTSQGLIQDRTIDNPQYQVKDITEYTTSPSIVTSTATSVISSTPVYLIPIGPVVHQRQPNNNLMIGNISVNNPMPQVNQNGLSSNPQNVLVPNSNNARNDQTGSQVILAPTMNRNIPQQQVPILIPNQQNQLYLVNQPLALPQQNSNQPLIAGNVTSSLTVTPQTTKMIYIPSCTLSSTTKPNILRQHAPPNLLNNKNVIDKPVPITQTTCSRNILLGNINTGIEVTSGTTKMIYTPSTSQKETQPKDVPSTTQINLTTSMLQNVFPTSFIDSKSKPPVSGGSFNPVCPTTEPPSYRDTILGKAREMDDSIQTVSTPGTRYLFRIKPGNGFVCEACRKFTKDECTFRNHIWNHFHFDQKACQSCTHEYVTKRQVGRCVLVNSIVCNLIKRSALEYKKMIAMLSSNEVIDISDDEEEKKQEKDKGESGTEVIVLEDDDDKNQNGLQIRITSATTISEEDYNTTGKRQTMALAEITEKENENSSVKKQTTIEFESLNHLRKKVDNGSTKQNCVVKSKEEFERLDGDGKKADIESAKQGCVEKLKQNESQGFDHDGKKADNELREHECVKEHKQNESQGFDLKNVSEGGEMSSKLSSSESTSSKYQTNLHDDKSRKELKTNVESKEIATTSVQQHLNSYVSKNNEMDKINTDTLNREPDVVNLYKKKNCENSLTHNEHTQEESTNKAYKLIEEQIMAAEHSSAFYMCGYEHCSFTSFRLMKYKVHLRENHMNEYNFVCCHCGMKDYYEESHIRHLHSHASSKSFALFSCPVRMCSYKSNLLHYYICHLNAHKAEELNLRCVYCNKTFQTTEKLMRHLKENILKFVNCNYCSFKFEKRRVVLDHIRNVHRDKIRMVTVTSQIVCLEREINFYNPPPAKAIVHQEDDVGKSMESINIPAILEQVQKESASKPDNVAIEKEKATTEVSNNKKIPEEDRLPQKQLKTEVKGKKGKVKNVGPKSLMCPHCNYLSYNLALYTRHVSLHEEEPDRTKRFVCNRCPYSIDSYSCFKKHSINHVGRSEIKNFDCTLCSFSTNLKSLIMDHLQENHEGAGYYTISTEVVISTESTCRFCDFKARHAEQVNLHEKLAHTGSDDTEQESSVVAETSKNETNSPAKNVGKESTKKLKYHCEYCSLEFKHKAQLFTHIQDGHEDIKEKKFTFYKCKYCSLGSTRKEMIVSHIEKEHAGKDIRILRKIELVERKSEENEKNTFTQNESMTSDNDSNIVEEVVIPDGNVFKNQFRCPKCNFTTMVRINAIRHIKEHPNLKPVREKDNGPKKTARKSTSKASSIQTPEKSPGKAHCSLIQNTELKENPFTAVKEAVDKLKQAEKSPKKDTYLLGEEDLHNRLSNCFTPIEKDIKFKCKICTQTIMKKFVLHRHVLEHLDVVFFKCKYCFEGTVEKSLLFGHIQKSHPQKTLLYHQLGRSEVDEVIKERLRKLSLDGKTEKRDQLDHILPRERTELERPSTSSKTKGGHKQNVKPSKGKEMPKTAAKLKCTYQDCRYTAHKATVMEGHLLYHGDKSKDFKCSLCDYRQSRYETLKHIYRQHRGLASAKALKIEEQDLADSVLDNSEIKSSRESSVDSISSMLSIKDSKFLKNTKGKKIKVESLTVSKTGSVYEMRKMFKCKECGIKKESVSSMYKHFSTSKCKRPPYQCSYCSFQRCTKKDILRHAKIRHPGKKMNLTPLPLSFKMAKLKIPIKQAFEGEDAQLKGSEDNIEISVDSKVSQPPILSPQYDLKEEICCGLCSTFKCDSIMKLQHHINTIHDGMLLHCIQCSYKTPLIKHMLNHCTNVHLQKQAKYHTHEEGTGHSKESATVKSPRRVSEISFPCVKCELKLSDTNKLRYHYFTHLEYKPNVCVHCGQGFQRLFSLQRHAKEKHPNKPIKYKYVKDIPKETKIDKLVEKTKKRRSELMKIKEESSSPKMGKKRALESDSDSEHSIKKSKKLHNAVETVLDEVKLDSGKASPMKYRVCLDEKGKRIFKCCHCSFTAGDNKTLRQHLSSHSTRLFKCCYCSFSSKIRSKAYRHCKTAHSEQEVKVLDRKTNRILTEHQSENVESGSDDRQTGRILRYNCYVCSKTLEGMKEFRKHLKRHIEFQTSRVQFNPRVILHPLSPKHVSKKSSKETNSETNGEDQMDKTELSENLNDHWDAFSGSICREISQKMETEEIDINSPQIEEENMDVKEGNEDPVNTSVGINDLNSNPGENSNHCEKMNQNESIDYCESEKGQGIQTDLHKIQDAPANGNDSSFLEDNQFSYDGNEDNRDSEKDFSEKQQDDGISRREEHDLSMGKKGEKDLNDTVENNQFCNKDENYFKKSEKMQEIEKDLSDKMQEIEKDLNNVENSLLSWKKEKSVISEISSEHNDNISAPEKSNSNERSEDTNDILHCSEVGKNIVQTQDQCDLSKTVEHPFSELRESDKREKAVLSCSSSEIKTKEGQEDDFGFANLI